MDSSSPDEINDFDSNTHRAEKRDRPPLNDRSDATHAFDVDSDGQRLNAVASSSRVYGDGPSTRMLQKHHEMSHGRSCSPIEEYQEEPKTTSHVKDIVKKFDNLDKGGSSSPHINLHQAVKMKSKMKPRVGKAYWRNAVI